MVSTFVGGLADLTDAQPCHDRKFAGEVALDFMFWPSPERKFVFLEPSYSYSFSNEHEQSLGVSVGCSLRFRN